MHTALETLEFPQVLRLVQMEAKSDPGRAALGRRMPATSLDECELLQSRLAEMVRYYHTEGMLPLAGLADTRSIYDGADFDIATAWLTVRSLRATQAIREALLRSEGAFPRLQEIAAAIPDLSGVNNAIGRYFTKDGKLREDASPALRSIRTKIHAKRGAIQKTLGDLMSRNADAVQESIVTIRSDRYCIPVRAERRNEIPGILHERSGSGASFFIEPIPIVEANNELADLLIDEREEIARMTREIARELFNAANDINEASDLCGELDAIQACAVVGDIMNATRPTFTTERKLHLIEARHPLIDERLSDLRSAALGQRHSERTDKVIPSTITLGPDTQLLVISGPNAGGKTVALKTAGLLVAMAASGLPVPAKEGTVIPVIDALHVTIGDDQSVLENLSTFSAYLVRMKRVLEQATPRSLVLLDELGSGTDPEEGSALAAAVIEHLTKVGSLSIVTTHLTALKSFAIDDARILNASMEFDAATGRPTFRLVQGLPGRSRAIETARIVGLPSSVIESAQRRLGEEYGKLDKLVAELQLRLSEAAAERQAAEETRARLDRSLAEAAAEREKFEVERKRLANVYRDEADRVRDDVAARLQSELKQLRQLDRKDRDRVVAKEIVERVTSVIPELVRETSEKLEVGDEVEHRRFKFTGRIASMDGKRAMMNVNGKAMQVELGDLQLKKKAPKEKESPKKAVVARIADAEIEASAELNLVGHRVEEALEESDKFIDASLMKGIPAIRLIHGFGTGVLRKSLREYLRKHKGVRSYRPGNEREGGDGATVAVLDV